MVQHRSLALGSVPLALTGLLAAALLLPACAPKAGARPTISMLRISGANPDRQVTVWGKIRNDFKDAKPTATAANLMDKLNEEVSFEVVNHEGTRDKLIPAFVPSTAEAAETTDSTWSRRLTIDFLLFPKELDEESHLLINNFYDPEKDQLSFDLTKGTQDGRPRVQKVEVVELDAKKSKITATLDKDAPASLTVWHHLGGRVFKMERKGSRLFFREFKESESSDHKVILVDGETWVSPPTGISAPSVEEEGEE